MSWYKRTIAKEQSELELTICNELLEIGMPKAQPPPFKVYITKPAIVPPIEPVTIYFPPEAMTYCSDIILKYQFEVCEEPDLTVLDSFCTPG